MLFLPLGCPYLTHVQVRDRPFLTSRQYALSPRGFEVILPVVFRRNETAQRKVTRCILRLVEGRKKDRHLVAIPGAATSPARASGKSVSRTSGAPGRTSGSTDSPFRVRPSSNESEHIAAVCLAAGQDASKLALPCLQRGRFLLEMVINLIRLREPALAMTQHRVDGLSRETERPNPRRHRAPEVVGPQIGQARLLTDCLILGAPPSPEAG